MTNESAKWRQRHNQQLLSESLRGWRRRAANACAGLISAAKGLGPIIAGVAVGIFMGLGSLPAYPATDDVAATIKFADHHWDPLNVQVPANQPLKIHVVNASNETIEFESFKLNRETAMTPGETITVKLPALSPGSYDFYDDFHQDVPEGTIVAK
jgi:hypothetical protein